jgi:hypothetical protein
MDQWVKSHVTLTVLIVLTTIFVVFPIAGLILSVIFMEAGGGIEPGTTGKGDILDSP